MLQLGENIRFKNEQGMKCVVILYCKCICSDRESLHPRGDLVEYVQASPILDIPTTTTM